jgi:hypothetical protein
MATVINPFQEVSSQKVEGALQIPAALSIPFVDGMDIVRDPSMLNVGRYSDIQNMRPLRPGFTKRKGQAVLHSTAGGGTAGTDTVVNLGMFSKGRKSEVKFYSQFSGGTVQQATSNPPTVTGGAFGATVYTCSDPANMIPACFENLKDRLIYCDGTEVPRIYSGDAERVSRAIVYKSTGTAGTAGTIPIIPLLGQDYTPQLWDSGTSSVIVMDNFDILTNPDALFIMTDIPCDKFTFTIDKANTGTSAGQMHYWNGTWTTAGSFSDGTVVSNCSMGTSGTMSWTMPTDVIPHYMFGYPGFWWRYSLASGVFDSEVEVSDISFESDWVNIQNMWDGTPLICSEAYEYIAADTVYYFYSGVAVTVGGMTTSDKLYICSPLPVVAIYADVGATANEVDATLTVKYYQNGNTWTTVSNMSDGTSEGGQTFGKNGWITFSHPADEFPTLFQSSTLYYYWYELTFSATLTATTVASFSFMPYLSLIEYGNCVNACAWKGRMSYAFELVPGYVWISAYEQPMVLSGDDSTVQEIGDGRLNPVTAQCNFHGELMVFQEERGEEGGCISLIQGYNPATFGKYLISIKHGTFSQKSIVVVEGLPFNKNMSSPDDVQNSSEVTFVFFLSHDGLGVTDGRRAAFVSEKVHKYFDAREASCIRRGYEKEMWVGWDSAHRLVRVGLVTGSTATKCNTFLAYDPFTGSWYHDVLGQELSCCTEVEASSGTAPVVQVGGGTNDGTVYLLNSTTNDVSTAIDGYAMMEFNYMLGILHMREMMLKTTATAGTCTVTPYINGVAGSSRTYDMTAERTNETIRRSRQSMNLEGSRLSLKFQNNTGTQGMDLLATGCELFVYEDK